MRATVPSPATLGLTRANAAADLEWLGWNNAESTELLWCLAAAGDPDLALNTVMRLYQGLDDSGRELDQQMRANEALRVRLLALLGASTALGDHLAAEPELWRQLAEPLPEPEEMLAQLLGAVDALSLIHI